MTSATTGFICRRRRGGGGGDARKASADLRKSSGRPDKPTRRRQRGVIARRVERIRLITLVDDAASTWRVHGGWHRGRRPRQADGPTVISHRVAVRSCPTIMRSGPLSWSSERTGTSRTTTRRWGSPSAPTRQQQASQDGRIHRTDPGDKAAEARFKGSRGNEVSATRTGRRVKTSSRNGVTTRTCRPGRASRGVRRFQGRGAAPTHGSGGHTGPSLRRDGGVVGASAAEVSTSYDVLRRGARRAGRRTQPRRRAADGADLEHPRPALPRGGVSRRATRISMKHTAYRASSPSGRSARQRAGPRHGRGRDRRQRRQAGDLNCGCRAAARPL